MNGIQHRSQTRAASELFLGLADEPREILVKASQAPDHIRDVLAYMPGKGYQDSLLGRALSAFLHFQPGYYWQDDSSLSVLEVLGEVGMKVTSMTVMGTSVPMLRACAEQPGVKLCDFKFPSAARVAGFYARAAEGKNLELMGYALHLVQDCCVWHHATGRLLDGHQAWEDQAEALWLDHVKRLMLNRATIMETLGQAVLAEDCSATSIEDLCESNAEWSRRWFAKKEHETCNDGDAIAVSVRAIASSIRAFNLMTKGG